MQENLTFLVAVATLPPNKLGRGSIYMPSERVQRQIEVDPKNWTGS